MQSSRPAEGPWRGETRATLALAWPLVATNLAQHGLTASDVIMTGWLGPSALAAGALASALFFMCMLFGIGLLVATSAMIARERGRNPHAVREVRRTLRQALWASVLLCLPCWLLLWHCETILLLFGQEPGLAHEAAAYMRALQWALLPIYFYIALRNFFAAMERPLWSLWIGITGLGVNVFANWCLMFGNLGFPALGLVGAGWASVFSASFMVAAMAVVLVTDRRFRRYHLFGRFWRADWPRFREFWHLGLPIGISILIEASIFDLSIILMGLFGETALAAHSITIQIASLSFMVPLGFSQTATVRVGRAYGARNTAGIARAGWTAFAFGVGFMALMALVMLTLPRPLLSIFLDLDVAENVPVIAYATVLLALGALFQIADGTQVMVGGMLRGLHDTRVPMIYSIVGYWGIGLPVGSALAFLTPLGGYGLWLGLAAGLAAVGILLLRRWLRRHALGLERD